MEVEVSVDLAWLSDVLGVAATEVSVLPTDAFNSRTVRLEVSYADGAVGPARLVLKRNAAAAWAIEAGRQEAAFYEFVRHLDPPPPSLVPSLAAGTDESSGDSFVLMPDLSATHRPPVSREQQIALQGVPSEHETQACVTALARHHGYWWNHAELLSGRFDVGSWSRDLERAAAYSARRRAASAAVDWKLVEPENAELCRQVLEHAEAHARRHLIPRFAAGRNLTLTHGDAYFANFLCSPSDPKTYLVDWQSPEVDHPGSDLALLLASFWTSEQRHERARERRCLQLYHDALRDSGASQYTWDDLVTDYQSGLLYWLLVPLQDAADGSPPSYWLPKLRCLADAVRDWNCLDLLPG
jgi:hypothetical protein